MRWYIGVDIGLGGAAALLDEKGVLHLCVDTPTFDKSASSSARLHNLPDILATIREFATYAHDTDFMDGEESTVIRGCIEAALTTTSPERPEHRNSTSTVIRLGMSQAYWEMAMVAGDLGYEVRWPSAWKAKMGLTADKGKAVEMAVRLWPDKALEFFTSRRLVTTKAQAEGRAEAALLAEEARRRG